MKITYSKTSFATQIGFNYLSEENPFYVLKDLPFIVDNKYFIIEKGFQSDGCTLKFKILQLIFGCQHTNKYLPASLIHDFILDNPNLVGYNRRKSSLIFKKALLEEKVNIFFAELMFLGVEFWQWKENRKTKKWK